MSSPAWTFGNKSKKNNKPPMPGPGQYQDSYRKASFPSYSFGPQWKSFYIEDDGTGQGRVKVSYSPQISSRRLDNNEYRCRLIELEQDMGDYIMTTKTPVPLLRNYPYDGKLFQLKSSRLMAKKYKRRAMSSERVYNEVEKSSQSIELKGKQKIQAKEFQRKLQKREIQGKNELNNDAENTFQKRSCSVQRKNLKKNKTDLIKENKQIQQILTSPQQEQSDMNRPIIKPKRVKKHNKGGLQGYKQVNVEIQSPETVSRTPEGVFSTCDISEDNFDYDKPMQMLKIPKVQQRILKQQNQGDRDLFQVNTISKQDTQQDSWNFEQIEQAYKQQKSWNLPKQMKNQLPITIQQSPKSTLGNIQTVLNSIERNYENITEPPIIKSQKPMQVNQNFKQNIQDPVNLSTPKANNSSISQQARMNQDTPQKLERFDLNRSSLSKQSSSEIINIDQNLSVSIRSTPEQSIQSQQNLPYTSQPSAFTKLVNYSPTYSATSDEIKQFYKPQASISESEIFEQQYESPTLYLQEFEPQNVNQLQVAKSVFQSNQTTNAQTPNHSSQPSIDKVAQKTQYRCKSILIETESSHSSEQLRPSTHITPNFTPNYCNTPYEFAQANYQPYSPNISSKDMFQQLTSFSPRSIRNLNKSSSQHSDSDATISINNGNIEPYIIHTPTETLSQSPTQFYSSRDILLQLSSIHPSKQQKGTFSISKRELWDNLPITPGPGHYSPKSQQSSIHKRSISSGYRKGQHQQICTQSQKLKFKKIYENSNPPVPGPGQYNVANQSFKGLTIPKSKRFNDTVHNKSFSNTNVSPITSPSLGLSLNAYKSSSIAYTIGKSKRDVQVVAYKKLVPVDGSSQGEAIPIYPILKKDTNKSVNLSEILKRI